MTFKDIPINSFFISNSRTFKKIDYNTGKDVYNYDLKEFQLYDEIQILEEHKFKLNY